jgi:hypothetical protein
MEIEIDLIYIQIIKINYESAYITLKIGKIVIILYIKEIIIINNSQK